MEKQRVSLLYISRDLELASN